MKIKNRNGNPVKERHSQGFTFVELLLVLAIITSGIMAAVMLITMTFSATMTFPEKLAASYLAQEGVELSNKVRSTYRLEYMGWDEIIEKMEGEWRIDYELQELEDGSGEDDNFFQLYEDGDDFFVHDDGGDETGFYRKLYIERGEHEDYEDDHMRVEVIVWWYDKEERDDITVYNELWLY